MSTAVIIEPIASPPPASHRLRKRLLFFLSLTVLTAVSLAVHGYHPYAEDGGLYATGIKHLLYPALFPHSLPFVEAHLRYSLFAPAIAGAVHLTHSSLEHVLLGFHFLSIWVTLLAVWLLARRCYLSPSAHAGALLLAAAWLTVPVAGTSLILMDPYVTARSISLPCTLLALTALLDLLSPLSPGRRLRAIALCALSLLLAAAAHPLMAAYAFGNVLLLATLISRRPAVRRWGTLSLCLLAILLAALLQALAAPDTAAYTHVEATRFYWFLSQWHWYEIVGLIAPLLILSCVAFPRTSPLTTTQEARQVLARMAVATGVTAAIVALGFAHLSSASYIVARLQPLRTLQTIYMVMILILGATLGRDLLRRHRWRWIVTFLLFGGIFFFVQRNTYPSSAHIEWPGASPRNHWEQAFLWISRNTPVDANFALDANYISLPGEDAQSFRAIAERSALPDYSKDGGEASITPALTAAWTAGQQAQKNLSRETDAARLAALHPYAVNWIVLQQQASTSFACPYRNELVKVCRLP